MEFTKGGVFGHYGVIFGLKSNIVWKTPLVMQTADQSVLAPEEQLTNFMCVDSEIFTHLCDLFPETAEALRTLAIEQREIIRHFHKQAQ